MINIELLADALASLDTSVSTLSYQEQAKYMIDYMCSCDHDDPHWPSPTCRIHGD